MTDIESVRPWPDEHLSDKVVYVPLRPVGEIHMQVDVLTSSGALRLQHLALTAIPGEGPNAPEVRDLIFTLEPSHVTPYLVIRHA
jgi:hypothetical protein